METVSLEQAGKYLRDGQIGVIPTDTVYGLVACAQDQAAVLRLYALKQRENKPGTIIAANAEQLVELGLKARYVHAVQQFWPGAISIVLPVGIELPYLHLGKHSLAVRVTEDKQLAKMLEQTGPILSTSANHPGESEAKTIQEAVKYFKDSVDFYVDGGDLSERQPSTVIRIVDDAVEILREGAVKIDEETGRILTQ